MSTLNVIDNALVKEAFAVTDATDVTAKTGTGTVVVMQGSPTLTSPTIADVSNMAVQSSTGNNTTDPLSIVAATYPNVPTGVGSLIRVENEIMRVTATGASLTLARAQSGTAAAMHANALDIFDGDGI